MTVLAHSAYHTVRHIRGLLRQPVFVALTLIQPFIWLLLFGALFKRVVDIPGFGAASYVDYLAPGIVVMTAMFSGGWAGIGFINDLEQGVIDRFLVSPVTRAALIAGRLVQQALVTVVQSLVLVGVALAIGADFPGGVAGVAVLLATAVVLGSAFGALSIGLAFVVRREESVVASVQLLLLPLTFLSSVFIERDLIPGWIRGAARFNPADWAVEAGRQAVGANADWGLVLSRGGYLLAFALACGWLGARGVHAYERSA